MSGNSTKFKDKFNASEQKLNDQLIQYGLQDCYNICDQRHPGSDVGSAMLRNACSFACRTTNWFDAPEHSLQANDIKSTLENIGDGFYSLAGSFSVL